VKPGDSVPDVKLYKYKPDDVVNLRSLYEGKRGLIFGLPGAFTPNCSRYQLPHFLTRNDELRKAGIEVMVCVAVNDPFVMEAWAEHNKVGDQIEMLADKDMELTKALGIVMDCEPVLGNKRMKRWSAIIDDNVFKTVNLETKDGGNAYTISGVDTILRQLGELGPKK
jgi:2-Cys peroxiredoxin 5